MRLNRLPSHFALYLGLKPVRKPDTMKNTDNPAKNISPRLPIPAS